MNVLDLFSGIGGFSLGLERAGMRTVAFCEIEPYPRAVLAKHWPNVPCYDDVRTLTAERLRADGISVDVICGGFPCQDISFAGKGAGIKGDRSGLWIEYARIIGELRPQYVIVENVSALLGRGLDRVLGDLASLGYDAEWHCIRAADLGAPHLRDRIWIISYPQHSDTYSQRLHRAGMHQHGSAELRDEQICISRSLCEDVANAKSKRRRETGEFRRYEPQERASRCSEDVADTEVNGREPRRKSNTTKEPQRREFDRGCLGSSMAHANGEQAGWTSESWPERDQWLFEPPVGRVANGISCRVDRLKGLGNAVVPQIPEIIGRAIMRAAS